MKAANSYGSVIRGVSQQVPQDRAEGQHTEQVNFLSDPVNGLVRRHGSIWQAEQLRSDVAPAAYANLVQDTATWASYDFDTGGKEYTLLYRKGAAVASGLPALVVYNKTDKVFLTVNRQPLDVALDLLFSGGISAVTAVGKYLYLCGNTYPVVGTSVNKFTASQNQLPVVWVRGGAYSRTFKIKYTLAGGGPVYEAVYTTPSASFQGTLTTADIAATDPEYVKKVNDRVNAYNSAVTAWIGTAAAAIQPAAIAQQLKTAVQPNVPAVAVIGSHIIFYGVLLGSLEVDDGGDGSLISAVWQEVAGPDKVSPIHQNNKIVKVRGRNSAEAYYLRAVSKDPVLAADPNNVNVGEVTWVEGGATLNEIQRGIFPATIVGNTLHIAADNVLLANLTPGPHPTFSSSTVGDNDTAPQPHFVGRVITYLGTFQNRLLVGCGGVLTVSRTDDYLNFYRSTVLTLPADDPFEMLPQGSEDDTLVHSVLYDQDLVVFGKKRQYRVSGSVPLTPTSANMSVLSNFEGVADCAPVAAGSYIFYAKRGNGYSDVHQMQPGQTENSPESFPASSQLDTYLAGDATELAVATGSPSLLFLRTTGARGSVFTFAYLDKQDGRKLDSWSRWDFNPTLGAVIGTSVVKDGLLVFFARKSLTNDAVFVVADLCPTVPTLSSRPYLDSNRLIALTGQPASSVDGPSVEWAAAFGAGSQRRLSGTLTTNLAGFLAQYPDDQDSLFVGALQSAYFTPTNPYVRDTKDKAILSGRLTVSRIITAFKEATGFRWGISYRDAVTTAGEFNGRTLGAPNNNIGIEPISTGQYNIPIGRETRQYTLTIFARKWYPLTVTALEWVGQFFNRVQRF